MWSIENNINICNCINYNQIIISIGKSSIQNFIISCTLYLWLTNLINSYMHRMHNFSYSQLVQFFIVLMREWAFARVNIVIILSFIQLYFENNIKHAFLLRQDTKVYCIEILRNFCLFSHVSYDLHTLLWMCSFFLLCFVYLYFSKLFSIEFQYFLFLTSFMFETLELEVSNYFFIIISSVSVRLLCYFCLSCIGIALKILLHLFSFNIRSLCWFFFYKFCSFLLLKLF